MNELHAEKIITLLEEILEELKKRPSPTITYVQYPPTPAGSYVFPTAPITYPAATYAA